MSTEEYWSEEAMRILKSELVRRGIDYKELAERLATIGIYESPRQLTTKINRGTFSFGFFLKAMRSIGVEKVEIGEVQTKHFRNSAHATEQPS